MRKLEPAGSRIYAANRLRPQSTFVAWSQCTTALAPVARRYLRARALSMNPQAAARHTASSAAASGCVHIALKDAAAACGAGAGADCGAAAALAAAVGVAVVGVDAAAAADAVGVADVGAVAGAGAAAVLPARRTQGVYMAES